MATNCKEENRQWQKQKKKKWKRIFNFIGKWNEYFMALIFANKSNLRPIGVGLYQTVTSMMNSGDWAGMFASVVIVFVPTVVIYAFLSDKIISGVTAGGNKG